MAGLSRDLLYIGHLGSLQYSPHVCTVLYIVRTVHLADMLPLGQVHQGGVPHLRD
jgi:hypothetical protein